ncbi:hypothetical protein SAMN05216276_100675 [Streptosporangium subroseum]|uniref:Uncharacterized protein n=1 Tax=Streptosporangium subroseum TaxID=106412 RepID=A0A239CUU1_9ACTN|nr:hypothetical protein [Streptosporangium subroseum]SNS23421.1 hypothetical protein SAMN05216276_100675 [Streptosporangium subroseum]
MLRWHRPLLFLSAAMAALTLVFLILVFVDDRTLDGLPIWIKPMKFAISFALYSFTWAWLLSLRHRAGRTSWWMGTALVVAAFAEVALITFQAAKGRHSHFNEATPLDGSIWIAMGVTIGVLMLANLIAAIFVIVDRQTDRVSTWTVRLGLVISTLGVASGGLMVTGVPGQTWAEDVAGAHSVGAADGGPGLPVVGWSTIGGDLRIPHFVGMHALQLLPLFALLLMALSARFAVLRNEEVRLRLVLIAGGAYGCLFFLLLWQALRGQSLIHPDGVTLTVLGVLAATVIGAAAVTLSPRREPAA